MFRSVLATMILLFGFPACAVIDLVPKMIDVDGDDIANMTLVNKSDHMEYVTVTLSKLINPGVPYDKEILEPVGMARNPQLYAYPFKLSLARGQSKKINLKPLAAVTQETVYRLDVKPSTEISGNGIANLAAGVAVNLSFSALVRQLPEKKISTLSAVCRANTITLTATGTTRYQAKNIKIDSRKVDDFNVYPGTPQMIPGEKIDIGGKYWCNRQ